MLEVIDITKKFAGEERPILRNVNLIVEEGEFISIMGKSGSGKSTLVSMMGCLDRPTTGELKIFGQMVTAMSDNQMAQFRKENIGFVFQSYHLISELNILDNLTLPLGYQGIGKKERMTLGMEMLERLDMKGYEKKSPNRLSGGEKQRIAIGRALIRRPKIVIADEPTGNLDSEREQEVLQLFKNVRDIGSTMILVTHDDEVAAIADRHFVIKDGLVDEIEELTIGAH